MTPETRINKNDLALRVALRKCYHNKCALSDEIIVDDFDVDHIIPASLKSKPSKLRERLAELGLPETFELDSLLNLIPVKRKWNRRKGDRDTGDRYTMMLLDHAASVAPKVIEEIQRFKRSVTVGQAKEVIRDISTRAAWTVWHTLRSYMTRS